MRKQKQNPKSCFFLSKRIGWDLTTAYGLHQVAAQPKSLELGYKKRRKTKSCCFFLSKRIGLGWLTTVLYSLQAYDLLQVPAQPYGGEVAPAKLSHDVISIVEEIANFHRMVST